MNHASDADFRTDSPLASVSTIQFPVRRADDEQQCSDDDERDAHGAQRLPTPPLGEVDGDGEEHEDGDREPDRQLADQLDGRLHRPQLIRLHDHDAAGVRPEALFDLRLGQADAVGQLLDDRRQVEHDVALSRLEELALVVDDADEGLVRPAVRLLPERLHGRAAEQVVGRAYRELAQAAGDRGRERLDLWRKTGLELGGNVDVRVQLVDEIERESAADLVVLEQPGARRHPLVGIQRLPLCPDRQRRHEADQPGKHDQHPDRDPAPARKRRSRVHATDPNAVRAGGTRAGCP